MSKADTPTSVNRSKRRFQLSQCCIEFKCLCNFEEMPQRIIVDNFMPVLHSKEHYCSSCGYPSPKIVRNFSEHMQCQCERHACCLMHTDGLIPTWIGEPDRDVQVFVTAKPRERFWEDTNSPRCHCNQAIVFVMIPEHNLGYVHHWMYQYV